MANEILAQPVLAGITFRFWPIPMPTIEIENQQSSATYPVPLQQALKF